MKYILIALAGLVIMVGALAFLIRNIMLKKNGVQTEAEVIAVGEDTRKGRGGMRTVSGYIHTLRYEVKGKMVEAKDRTGYVQPFSKGSEHTIIYSRKNPEIFDYAEQIDRNIKLYGGLAAVGAVFAVRFLMLAVK
ncbi:MAG: DUF3592 domain-containing protein [Ruminococcus sp.]|nr:DUF3592 domain-containing protein [Ruminococcus sp.]